MLKHCSLQELGKSREFTIRFDLHFIAVIIDTADSLTVIKQFSDLVTVSNGKFPCTVFCFCRFAVRTEKLIDYILQCDQLSLIFNSGISLRQNLKAFTLHILTPTGERKYLIGA